MSSLNFERGVTGPIARVRSVQLYDENLDSDAILESVFTSASIE